MVGRFLASALLGFAMICAGAPAAKAMTCHVEGKPTLGLSADSSAALVVLNLAAPGSVRPRPCPGDGPSVPSADLPGVAVWRDPFSPHLLPLSLDGLHSGQTSLRARLSTRDLERPPRR
jgi:hypothetical protein